MSDPKPPTGLYSFLASQHLFDDYARLIAMGVYRRLPEFRGRKIKFELADVARLSDALGREVHEKCLGYLIVMATRLIEHELVLIRVPSDEDVLEEVHQFSVAALDCLQTLLRLQQTFNDGQGGVAEPSFDMTGASKSVARPPDAKTAAVDLIKRNLQQPVPAFLELGPFIETCVAIRDRFTRKRGPKADTFLVFFLHALAECAAVLGDDLELPSKATLEAGKKTKFQPYYEFVRAALAITYEQARSVLAHDSISEDEKEAVLRKVKGYADLKGTQLRERLVDVRSLKISGLQEFLEVASRD